MTTPAHAGNKENAMSRDWTKEPWKAGRADMVSYHGHDGSGPFKNIYAEINPTGEKVQLTGEDLPYVVAEAHGDSPDECIANAQRISACVNACAPLSDPTTSIPAMLRVAELARSAECGCSRDNPRCTDDGHEPNCWYPRLEKALSALLASDEMGGA